MKDNRNERIDILDVLQYGDTSDDAPKVYFTCAARDVDSCLDRLCSDISECCDRRCVIYYKKDMDHRVPEEELDFLDGMDLVAVPITRGLLCEENAASGEIEYALRKGKTVLPFMMDPALIARYGHSSFGMSQWISPRDDGKGALPYKVKLRTFLDDIFLPDETVKRIKEEFTARIFFSYRKKDREEARRLMERIHSVRTLRDVAIWYDEYLPLARDFLKSIKTELQKSDAVVFLVTENLLDKGNFVIDTEYPIARDQKKSMFPIPADGQEHISHTALKAAFDDDFPRCTTVDGVASDIELNVRDESDPVHQYFIALAYLNGIDVEVNRERAIELLTRSAEADYHEMTRPALDLLVRLYRYEMERDGKLVRVYERLCAYLADTLGDDAEDVLDCRISLAFAYDDARRNGDARRVVNDVYRRRCVLFGEESPVSVKTYCVMIGFYYGPQGDEDRFYAMLKEARLKLDRLADVDDDDVVSALYHYAYALGLDYGYSAFEVYEEILARTARFKGEDSPAYSSVLGDLCDAYYELELFDDAIREGTRFHAYLEKQYGKGDKYTLAVYQNLARVYYLDGRYDEALERIEELIGIYQSYELEAERIIEAYYNAALCYRQKEDTATAIERLKAAHELCSLGEIKSTELTEEVSRYLNVLLGAVPHVLLTTQWNELWGLAR